MSTNTPEDARQPQFDPQTAQPTAQQTALPSEQPTTQLPEEIPAYSAPQSGGETYGAPYVAPYAAPARQPVATTVKDTNTYALVAVILAFIAPLAGIIFGHLGLNQIKRTGDAGRGLALTAVIYGYCAIALGILFVVLYIGVIAVAIGAASSSGYYSY